MKLTVRPPPVRSLSIVTAAGEVVDRSRYTRATTVPLPSVADRDCALTWTPANACASSSQPANAAVTSGMQDFARLLVLKDLSQRTDPLCGS